MIVERLNYNMSDVKTDDSTHRYYNVGSYINTTDDGTSFTSTDITVRSKDPEDLCDYKTSRTNLKTGFAANGWHLGLKERITDTQHLLKASQIMGVARTDGTVTYETLSSLPDVGLTMDASTYRVDFNDYFSLKFFPVNAGGGAEHIFKKKLVEDYPLYDYYGVRWLMGPGTTVDMLEPDSAKNCEFYSPDATSFIEYFPKSLFYGWNPDTTQFDILLDEASHNYVTKSGSLGADATWTAGTYYLTGGGFGISTYKLTLDASAGNVVIKTDGTSFLSWSVVVSAPQTQLLSANTSLTRQIYFTSRNDDSVGEQIAGSTGNPTAGDQTKNYIYGAGLSPWVSPYLHGDINLNYCNFGYVMADSVIELSNTRDTTLSHAYFHHNTLPSQWTALMRSQKNEVAGCRNIDISDTIVDPTNTVLQSNCYAFWHKAYENTRYRNTYINFPGASAGVRMHMRAPSPRSDPYDSTFTNCRMMDMTRGVYSTVNAAGTHKIDMSFCTFTGFSEAAISCSRDNPAFEFARLYLRNNVFASNTRATFNQNVTSSSDYNIYYADTTVGISLGVHDKTDVNPTLGSLIGGTIRTGCFLPNGSAVTNLSVAKTGSDTFANLGINNNLYTATGFKYVSTDLVTPGAMYDMSNFIYLNKFSADTVSDGNYATSTVDLSILVYTIQSWGIAPYFDSTSKIQRVDVFYVHEGGRNRTRLIHIPSTGRSIWHVFSPILDNPINLDGTWQKTKINVYGYDGTFTSIPRSIIGNSEDITHLNDVMYLNS